MNTKDMTEEEINQSIQISEFTEINKNADFWFKDEQIADTQLLHFHQRIEKLEKHMNNQTRTAKLIRRLLKLFA